jgi:dihydrodipicolinate synthase/N-acetylneuraminate lyase
MANRTSQAPRGLSRRQAVALMGGTLAAAAAGARAQQGEDGGPGRAAALHGAFMILHTPFTDAGAVDWEDLAREARFVDEAGAHGVVWPQGSSGVATLSRDERMRGMEILAETMAGRRAALVLGVQGRDIPEMLEYARRAEALAPTAFIAMPPSTGTSMADYAAYFRALAATTARPVFVQTSGGAKGLPPTTDLIVALAKEFPHFGYVKEESPPVVERMKALVRQRPPMRRIFGATFAEGWLYEMRLGLDGVITGNAMYADLMGRMWELHLQGKSEELRDAYSRFLLMRNLSERIAGVDLYVMKKRGLFKTMVSRRSNPAAGPLELHRPSFEPQEIEEIEYRFAALKPLLVE